MNDKKLLAILLGLAFGLDEEFDNKKIQQDVEEDEEDEEDEEHEEDEDDKENDLEDL